MSTPATGMPERLSTRLARVEEVDPAAAFAAHERHCALAMPAGALGDLETLGARLAAIAGRCPPPVCARPALVVAAGDHAVHAQGVSPWPVSVTASMVRTLADGRATANAFAGVVGARVDVLDVGVAIPLEDQPNLRRSSVRAGTRDLGLEAAMTVEEAIAAVLAGAEAAEASLAAGADLLLTGDMGIANTTAAAALVASFTGLPATQVTGRGTGIDDAAWERKVRVVQAAVTRHRGEEPMSRLAGVGGLEHAALVGVILAAAAGRVPVVLDGVSAGAAALVATALAPAAAGYLVAGHRSSEPGASAALAHLALVPVLDLGLRLGEGTGALLAVPIVRAAAAALSEVATLDEVLGG